jgi:hypothetical protein
MEALILIAICALIYFIPTIVAGHNKKQNAGAIGALNLLLGWTLVGWVVALVWAMSKDVQPVAQVQVNVPTSSSSPKPLAPLAAQKKCPDCAEMILAEARKCRFCGHEFASMTPATGQ